MTIGKCLPGVHGNCVAKVFFRLSEETVNKCSASHLYACFGIVPEDEQFDFCVVARVPCTLGLLKLGELIYTFILTATFLSSISL